MVLLLEIRGSWRCGRARVGCGPGGGLTASGGGGAAPEAARAHHGHPRLQPEEEERDVRSRRGWEKGIYRRAEPDPLGSRCSAPSSSSSSSNPPLPPPPILSNPATDRTPNARRAQCPDVRRKRGGGAAHSPCVRRGEPSQACTSFTPRASQAGQPVSDISSPYR